MGFDMKVLEETQKAVAPIPGREYFIRGESFTPIAEPHAHPTATGGARKPRLIVIDAAGWLNIRKASFSSLYGRTVGELCDVLTERLQWYLDDASVGAVVLLFDQRAPEAKAVSRKPSDKTPVTPFHLVSGSDTPHTEENALKAWIAFLNSTRDNSDSETLRLSSDGVDIYSCVLPPSEGDLGVDPSVLRYESYLQNRHFKQLLYKRMSAGMAQRVRVPNGKWVSIQARDYCVKKTAAGFVPAESALRHSYYEGDRGAVYFATAYADRYDADIDSDDGDVITSCLLSAFLRIAPIDPNYDPRHNLDHAAVPSPELLENTVFRNSLRVLKCQFRTKSRSAIIDINNLYLALMRLAAIIWVQTKIRVRNIVGCWTVLAMLSAGNDYIDGSRLPGLGAGRLFGGFFANLMLYGDLVAPHTSPDGLITIDPDSFAKFVMGCYAKMSAKLRPVVRYRDVEATVRNFNAAEVAALQKRPLKVADLRVLCGSLTWALNYWATGARKDRAYPNEFTEAEEHSLYGFVRCVDGTNAQGHATVDWADDADVRVLRRLHTNNGHAYVDSPSEHHSPSSLDGLKG